MKKKERTSDAVDTIIGKRNSNKTTLSSSLKSRDSSTVILVSFPSLLERNISSTVTMTSLSRSALPRIMVRDFFPQYQAHSEE